MANVITKISGGGKERGGGSGYNQWQQGAETGGNEYTGGNQWEQGAPGSGQEGTGTGGNQWGFRRQTLADGSTITTGINADMGQKIRQTVEPVLNQPTVAQALKGNFVPQVVGQRQTVEVTNTFNGRALVQGVHAPNSGDTLNLNWGMFNASIGPTIPKTIDGTASAGNDVTAGTGIPKNQKKDEPKKKHWWQRG